MKYTVFILRRDGVNTGYNPSFIFDNKTEFLEFIDLCLKMVTL